MYLTDATDWHAGTITEGAPDMDELRMAPQDRRLAGRRLHFDGRE